MDGAALHGLAHAVRGFKLGIVYAESVCDAVSCGLHRGDDVVAVPAPVVGRAEVEGHMRAHPPNRLAEHTADGPCRIMPGELRCLRLPRPMCATVGAQ